MSEKIKALLARVAAIKNPLDAERTAKQEAVQALMLKYQPEEQALRAEIKTLHSKLAPLDNLMVTIAKNKDIKGEMGEIILPALEAKVKELEG